jgi:hypothetical protein
MFNISAKTKSLYLKSNIVLQSVAIKKGSFMITHKAAFCLTKLGVNNFN